MAKAKTKKKTAKKSVAKAKAKSKPKPTEPEAEYALIPGGFQIRTQETRVANVNVQELKFRRANLVEKIAKIDEQLAIFESLG